MNPVETLPPVLVIEDEDSMQGIVEHVLTENGFAPDIVSSGEEALTLFRARKNYKALIIDIALKGRLDGWEVATKMREIDASLHRVGAL